MRPQKSDFQHPLADTVMAMFERTGELDTLAVALGLGAPDSHALGLRAYRSVAADILMVLAAQGRLVQHGEVDRRRPWAGGHWYTLPDGGGRG